ncbi:TetR family transcriptional regulator [Streptomyces actinomycinicus]|uniref:TetR family transcriptional regulator n=1 Tax=Streptomyces actinomycinicus TaxID=1695166 RepID=A0A937ESU7_9ACTN|nr:TetR/AcrR family transcriptional regulator [Streptomyces actinomycinicus]MBL1087299.1 TetR family transcriptional regulator [Streptomyces actinomycinicus]
MSTSGRRTLITDAAIATVARAGLRGLTHRAVDVAAGLPAGSTSYYFRTRASLIEACYLRLAELDLADVDQGVLEQLPPHPGALSRNEVAIALAETLHRWLTTGRERQLARFELILEAARNPDLRPRLHEAGMGARARASKIIAGLGATRPEESAELLVAWTEGLLFDYLAGALADTRSIPTLPALTATARRMLDAALAEEWDGYPRRGD